MNIIITMAGEGRRFKEIGITEPKHLIEVKGKTLFEWAMLSLKNFYEARFIFITRKGHNSTLFIKEKSQSLGIEAVSIRELDILTKGQAETVLAAEEAISNPDDELAIYNIDTYVEPKELKPEFIRGDGWVPVFKADGTKWSFAKFNEEFKITNMTEKVRISDYGTIGFYYFKSFNLYKQCYYSYQYEGYKEKYIAPIYNVMISDPKLSLFAHVVNEASLHVLGTPEDIEEFNKR